MVYCRLIAPDWVHETPKVLEGYYNDEQIKDYNERQFYNVYFYPNSFDNRESNTYVTAKDITKFEYIFVDYDEKERTYENIDQFIAYVRTKMPNPTSIVSSGHGCHIYWRVSDLSLDSYLKLTRRAIRTLNTDPAVAKIAQLMRLPGTLNTKKKDALVRAEVLVSSDSSYTCEELAKHLLPLTFEDEQYCKQHIASSFGEKLEINIDAKLPLRFGKLLELNHDIKELWINLSDDRSGNDFKLARILRAENFTRDEALLILSNCAKALTRAPHHRVSYATNIVNKLWIEAPFIELAQSVDEIQSAKDTSAIDEKPFRCYTWVDNTERGFRLKQVIGLVAGSGVGKTTFALNMFLGFAASNPEYHHFFIALEQPRKEIAERWTKMCGKDSALAKQVHVIDNYDNDGKYRALGLPELQQYLIEWEKRHNRKVGCVVIDHIGALKRVPSKEEKQQVTDLSQQMKTFACETNTLLIMQSQAPRTKAGDGDIEMGKDAAYGSVNFEGFCDYLITVWQPLKKCYDNAACPTVMAYKFCKIRHKNVKADLIQEDQVYFMYFDPSNEQLRRLTQEERINFEYFASKAASLQTQEKRGKVFVFKEVGDQSNESTAHNNG